MHLPKPLTANKKAPIFVYMDNGLAQAFGVYGEKKFLGRIYDAVHRIFFLIAPDGIILKTYSPVQPEAHTPQVLRDLITLNS
jgi:peroxiredoxin Q/BCP